MEHNVRTQRAWEFFDDCIKIQEVKGKDYTTDGDAYKDIRDEAKAMDVTPDKVLWMAMNKHWKAVRKYCKDGQVESEPIKERLKDLANYVSLLAVYIETKETEESQ